MADVKFSVVIPVFGQVEFLADAIRSVLHQDHGNVEAIVVDDASPDRPIDVVNTFADPRLKYIAHQRNRGLAASRNTGYRAATGQIVGFLDADDYYHPGKVAAHVAFLSSRPEVGCSYNARYELHHDGSSIRELSRPPRECTLADLVMGFPFAPSDMVVRREWFDRVGGFDERLIHFSEDLDINCRLALEGCIIAGVDRALNYRRYHSSRRLKVRERLGAALEVIDWILADQRCPDDVRRLKSKAVATHSLVWAFYSFAQNDTEVGREAVRAAVASDPSLIEGRPTALMNELLQNSIADESIDHESLLDTILVQLPEELRWVAQDRRWAVGQGYLRRALRASLWGEPGEAEAHLRQAGRVRAQADDTFVNLATCQLLNLEHESGPTAAADAVARLCALFRALEDSATARHLRACYHLNKAFRSYANSRFADTLVHVGKAVVGRPHYLVNRGVMAVSIRALMPAFRPRRETGHV
jgi:glycosyltransferase involved in cell wall biosynthesis